jgi:hypothetical protein
MYMVRRTQVRGLNQRMCIRFQGFSPALEDVVTDPSGWHPVPCGARFVLVYGSIWREEPTTR